MKKIIFVLIIFLMCPTFVSAYDHIEVDVRFEEGTEITMIPPIQIALENTNADKDILDDDQEIYELSIDNDFHIIINDYKIEPISVGRIFLDDYIEFDYNADYTINYNNNVAYIEIYVYKQGTALEPGEVNIELDKEFVDRVVNPNNKVETTTSKVKEEHKISVNTIKYFYIIIGVIIGIVVLYMLFKIFTVEK